MGGKDYFTTAPKIGLNGDLFNKQTQARNKRNASIADDHKLNKNSKKSLIADKMQLYNTMKFPGKSSLISDKLFAKKEGKIMLINSKSTLVEHHNKKSLLIYLRMKVIALHIQKFLSYSDFCHFMLTSKQIFNQELLLRAQINLITKGLTKEMREKLWRQKCKISLDKKAYEQYYKQPTDCEHDIAKDIKRTFTPPHEFCKDPNNYKKLQRVLHAFAVKYPDIGYIQGLNFLVGNLILQFPEDVFVVITIVCLLGS